MGKSGVVRWGVAWVGARGREAKRNTTPNPDKYEPPSMAHFRFVISPKTFAGNELLPKAERKPHKAQTITTEKDVDGQRNILLLWVRPQADGKPSKPTLWFCKKENEYPVVVERDL